jgi:hypothetical protein
MKWNNEDIELYLQSKEYVDTVLLPLLPISFDERIKQSANMTDFISTLSVQLERQFRGRLILLPGFAYITSRDGDKHYNELLSWEEEIVEAGFKHVFYLTSDSGWKNFETNLKGDLIWLPSIPLGQMDAQYKNSILEDQVKQLLHVCIQKWANE